MIILLRSVSLRGIRGGGDQGLKVLTLHLPGRTEENLSSLCFCRDSNPACREYRFGALLLEQFYFNKEPKK